ncbi:unnamed protein product [Adineta ricciae]|nr:unnamed protein product [Adineta ricciae]
MPTNPISFLDYLDTLAVVSGGLFAGAALYVSIGQVPALRQFGLNDHWRFFPYMYKNSAPPQGCLAAIAGVASIAHATRIHGSPFDRNLWIIAGTTFLAIIPYTLACIAPVNNAIIGDNKSVDAGNESKINVGAKKDLLDKWAVLHLVRTVGSVASFGAMVFGLSRH